MNMNYGLIKLAQAADVTITVAADGSSMAPDLRALPRLGYRAPAPPAMTPSSSAKTTPLGTTGLTYLGDVQNPDSGSYHHQQDLHRLGRR
jgi:hypothetical protein